MLCCGIGDTLFSLGCGRLFEGTPEQMFKSLQKLQSLPAETWSVLQMHTWEAQREMHAKYCTALMGCTTATINVPCTVKLPTSGTHEDRTSPAAGVLQGREI